MEDRSGMSGLTTRFGTFSINANNAKTIELEVSEIHFTQRTVSVTFQDGRTLAQLTQQLVTGEVLPKFIAAIRVVKYQGRWTTLDNRRLRVFKDAFIEKIPVVVCDLKDASIAREFHQKRTNKTISDGGIVQPLSASLPPSAQSRAHFDDGSFVFTKKVLSWTFEQINMPLSALMHTPDLPSTYAAHSSHQYYQGFLNWILEEARATLQTGMEAEARSEVVALELAKSKISKNADNPSILTFDKKTITKQPFKSGDVLLLQNNKMRYLQLIAMVSYLKENPDVVEKKVQVKVIMEESLRDQYSYAPREWTAKLLGSVITHSRMYEVCTQSPVLDFQAQLLTGNLEIDQDRFPYLVKHPAAKVENPLLNPSQRTAVEEFLDLKSGIQLVQGPPGTGKTTMTVILLEELLKLNKRVLVCAPSNKAVQVLAERCLLRLPNAPVVLVGVEDRLPEDSPLQDIFIHTWAQQIQDELSALSDSVWGLLTAPQKLKEIENGFLRLFTKIQRYQFSFLYDLNQTKLKAEKLLQNIKRFFGYQIPIESDAMQQTRQLLSPLSIVFTEISIMINKYAKDDSKAGLEGQLLDQSKIIFSTLSVSGRKSFKEMNPVDVLIVDEAGQCVEAETLIPFVTKPKKCLLIGDTNQLPATVLSQEAERRGFGRSLLFRLLEDCRQEHTLLNVQYRMRPAISRWPSVQYYQGQIRDDESVMPSALSLSRLQKLPEFMRSYSFVNILGKEESNAGHSFINQAEAERIDWMLAYLKQHYQIDLVKQVGVITFYKGQADFLQRKLKPKYGEVKIQTVDSFQGSENDIILISFVRSNERNQIGFLKDFRRLNVALTRAKQLLVMFGHAQTLMGGVHDLRCLIQDAQRRGCFFEDEVIKQEIQPRVEPKVQPKSQPKANHQPKPQLKTQSATPIKKKPAPCRFFNGTPDSCRKGEKCDFSHAKGKSNAK